MGTHISGIVKSMLQVGANVKTAMPDKEKGEDFTVSFLDLMNQNGMPNMNISAGSHPMDIQAGTKNNANSAYDTYSGSYKNVSVKEGMTPEQMREASSEALDTFEEEIRDVLKEELGVTDEEISDALESLGLSLLDLKNLPDLASLVQELTGKDIGTLFASSEFQHLIEQVQTTVQTLCEELGINRQDLDLLASAWEEAGSVELPDAEHAQETGDQTIQNAAAEEAGAEAEDLTVNAVSREEAKTAVSEQKNPVSEQEKWEVSREENPADQAVSKIGEETEQGPGEQSEADQSGSAKSDTSNAGIVFADQQTARTEEFIMPREAVPYQSQIDTIDLINQIARNVRVTISATETSMEMQLNPENLGKIYLNVSEKEGVVRAQIAAQNAAVKEALETQVMELRQSLNQQGIKVDAIEVTVATHEFEQNLEENARQEQQAQQQMEESQKQTRKNLNLNDLDSMSGLMSEEEQLAAQIMRDNGNQIDFTA